MKTNYIYLVFLMATMLGFGQVRIVNSVNNIPAPRSSAFIDATSIDYLNATANVGKGLLYPRTDLTTFTFSGGAFGTPGNYPTYYDGFVVYNTASGGKANQGTTEGTLSEGFWYYKNKSNTIDGGTWIAVGSSGGPSVSKGPNVPDSNHPAHPEKGDVYVDESTGDIYTYVNNKWTNKTMNRGAWFNRGGAVATSNTDDMYVMSSWVGIGTRSKLTPSYSSQHASERLSVNGTIGTTNSVYADYVFEEYLDGASKIKADYKFKSLEAVERFIKINKHLPGVTGIKALAKTEDGRYVFNLTELSVQSLEKIEELYLHTIAQNKQLKAKDKKIKALEDRLAKIEHELGL